MQKSCNAFVNGNYSLPWGLRDGRRHPSKDGVQRTLKILGSGLNRNAGQGSFIWGW